MRKYGKLGFMLLLPTVPLAACSGLHHESTVPSSASPQAGASQSSNIRRALPLPPQEKCELPTSERDLELGARAIVEATVVHGRARADGQGASVIPLEGVKVLWSTSEDTPQEISVSNTSVDDADLLLDAGRYVLLLGSDVDHVYYLAHGRAGAFEYADTAGNSFSKLCTVYASDGKAHPPVKAKGTISRESLVTMAIEAARQATPTRPGNPAHT
jgi:hypothetical protein